MVDKAIKWAWDDDEEEVDLLSTGEVPKGLQKIAPEEKIEGLSNNEIKEQLLSGDLKLPKEFRSTLDLDLSEAEESEIRAKHRKYEDWAYESERDYIDTSDSNKSIHSIIENDSEVSKSDIEEANNLLQKRIDRLKLKQVTNEATDEVIISSSGMSLSDYLNKTYLRGNKGRKRKREFNRREEDIARLESRKNDPLYAKGVVKHLEQVERRKLAKVKQTQAIRKAYNKDRYTKMSPNEKQLLKSLGMTEQELISQVGYNSILDEKDKARLLSEGYFGTKTIDGIGVKQRYTTLGDIQILEFLYRFQVATINILSIALDKGRSAITGQLNKMYNMGLVEKLPLEGNLYIWGLTKLGQSIITDDDRAPKRPKVKGVSQLLTINYVVACLYSNKVNALNLDDFPYYGREFQGKIVRGEDIIPERFFRSALYKESFNLTGKYHMKSSVNTQVLDKGEILWREWELHGKKGISPELVPGQEFLYLLYSSEAFDNSYVIPDLVVRRPRLNDGSPQNIAIEVERASKSVAEYRKKLIAYKQDKRVYSKVVYITSNKSTVEKIIKAAESIGFEDYDIVPFLDVNGKKVRVDDPWAL